MLTVPLMPKLKEAQQGMSSCACGMQLRMQRRMLLSLASHFTPRQEAVDIISVGMQLRHDGLMELDRGAAVAVLEKLLEFLALAGSKQPWSSDAQRVTRSSGQAVLEVEALALDRD